MVIVEEPEFTAVQILAISPEQIVLHRGVQLSEVTETVVSLTYKFATLFCTVKVAEQWRFNLGLGQVGHGPPTQATDRTTSNSCIPWLVAYPPNQMPCMHFFL
jgi:hypothetical protein